MARVREVNSDPHYLYRVVEVIVFGSYLTDVDKLSDVDLAIDLVPKEQNRELRNAAFDGRIEEAEQKGRRFSNYLKRYNWPLTEVTKYLKSRSRSLSFHHADEPILEDVESRVPDPRVSLLLLLRIRQLMLLKEELPNDIAILSDMIIPP